MENPVRHAKVALRDQRVAVRTHRDAGQLLLAAQGLAAAAWSLDPPATVAAFVGVGTEPPTLPLVRALVAGGIRVLLPGVRDGSTMAWAPYTAEDPLPASGRLGLREPSTGYLGGDAVRRAGLILVPALAVDRVGHRLGRGAGYYDRMLATVSARVVAVVFDDEVVDEVPVEPHDVTVDGALTPSGLVVFRRPAGGVFEG